MTAVIYARYSSDNQREESIEGQIRECTAYAEKNGITVIKHYIDRALSAKTDNRPDFQQMIKDSEKRLFDIVLVWKLDRFARNRYDSAHYEYQLERNHVKLVSATEPISDSPAGIMVKSMLTGMAEYYSAELSEKVVRGMTENVLKGKYNGGTIPIGFKVDEEKFFQIDPLKAPFVVEAFQRYNDGATMKELMNWLNDSGVTTNRNQKFTYNSIQTLLTNRRYIGENRFKDIVMPDSIPAIVDKDLFEEVQLKIKKNSRAPARHKAEDDYLLTTKLFCGMCGAMMFGECGTGRNKVVHHYYKCATAKRFKTCKKKTVRKEWLEDLVVAETMKLIQDDAVIDAIVAEVMELQDQENTTLPLLEKQMREVENGIENMLNAIQAGVLTNSTKLRLEKLEAQQKELEVRIAEEKIARPRLSENQVRFWLTRFRKLDPNVKSHRETLINTFVNAVYLYDEKVLITFNYKDGTKTITFDEIAAKDAPEGNGSDLGCFAPPKKAPRRISAWGFFASNRQRGGQHVSSERVKDNVLIGCKGQVISQTKVAVSLSFFKCGIILHEPGGSGTCGCAYLVISGLIIVEIIFHQTFRTHGVEQIAHQFQPGQAVGHLQLNTADGGVIVAMGAVILPDGDQKAGLHAGMVQLLQHLLHFLPVYGGGGAQVAVGLALAPQSKAVPQGQTVLLHIALRPLQPGKRIRQVIVLSLPGRDRRAALAGRYADNGGVRLSIVGVDKGSYQRAGLHPRFKDAVGVIFRCAKRLLDGEKLFGCGNRPVFKASAGGKLRCAFRPTWGADPSSGHVGLSDKKE